MTVRRKLIAFAVLSALLLTGCSGSGTADPNADLSFAIPELVGGVSISEDATGPVKRPAIDVVSGSIVRIVGFGCGSPAFGSGFAVRPDLVVTSGHLVTGRDPESLAVMLPDGTEFAASLIGFDQDRDLAALQLEENILRPVNLVTTVPLVSGVAVGIRSADGAPSVNEVPFDVDARVKVNWDGVFRDTEASYNGLRIDAEIRPGDSGSGLFINDIDVIGLIHSKNRNGVPRGYAVGSADISLFISTVDPAVEVVSERCA